jgi:hypothetical protein
MRAFEVDRGLVAVRLSFAGDLRRARLIPGPDSARASFKHAMARPGDQAGRSKARPSDAGRQTVREPAHRGPQRYDLHSSNRPGPSAYPRSQSGGSGAFPGSCDATESGRGVAAAARRPRCGTPTIMSRCSGQMYSGSHELPDPGIPHQLSSSSPDSGKSHRFSGSSPPWNTKISSLRTHIN